MPSLFDFFLPGCAKFKEQYAGRSLPATSTSKTCNLRPEELPLISIVIPSYNQGQYIEETIRSVLDQNYPRLELFVIDGGSTDNTLDVIGDYEQHLTAWVSEADDGQAHAINKGFSMASGDILAWLNSDDVFLGSCLWKVVRSFVRNPDLDVIYGHRIIIDDKGRDVGKWIMPAHRDSILSYADFVPQETLFWRSQIWRKAGAGLDENFQFALDWDLLLRFVAAGARFERINSFTGGFRRHASQKTLVDIDQNGFDEMDRLRLRAAKDNLDLPRIPVFRMRVAVLVFLARAKLFEILWQTGLIKID